MQRKTCTTCGKAKMLNCFWKGDGKFGRRAKCIECMGTANVARYWKNLDAYRETSRKCRKAGYYRDLVKSRQANRANTNRYSHALRAAVIKKFGGKCAMCPCRDSRCLQLDHKNGGGTRERKLYASRSGVYRFALANPEWYQLLCANCNWIKRHEQKEFGFKAE